MTLILLATGCVLLASPAFVDRWGCRLHPAYWARWIAWALVTGALAVEASLLLIAAPTVLASLGVHGLATSCARMAGSAVPGGAVAGWLAAAAVIGAPAAFARSWCRGRTSQRRITDAAMLAPAMGDADSSVRIVDLPEPVAFSAAAARRQVIVVSRGLVDVLRRDELAAVIRHERAHLRGRHGRRLLLASALDAAFLPHPFVRLSTARLRCALERAADEEAVDGDDATRGVIRRALMACALVPPPAAVAGFGPVDTVVARIAALSGPSPHNGRSARFALAAPLVLVGLAAAAASGMAGGNLVRALTMPVQCHIPSH